MSLLPRFVVVLLLLTGWQLGRGEGDGIPEPMPLVDEPGGVIQNFLLLGSDTTNPQNAGRTDVILVVSVNHDAGTVALLSIPRDLYVYIPDWGMQRVNTAFGHGENDDDPDAGGAELLARTIEYNLGIPIDNYARVDFNGFKEIVDNLGGIEISVDCAIEDWRLRESDLNPALEENWEMFVLPIGVHHMDGDLALWYVRSRRTSSDFDRGRRQQAVLRGLWHRVRELNLLQQLVDLWPQITETVTTDIDAVQLASLIPLAVSIQLDHISSYRFHLNTEVTAGRSPEGASVLLPVRDAVHALGQQVMTPPTENQLRREGARIEVVNASGIPGLGRVAADRLALEGFLASVSDERVPYQERTTIVDYSGQTKGSSLAYLIDVLRAGEGAVMVQPTAGRAADFRVVIGSAYRSCTYDVLQPASAVAVGDA